MIPARAGQQERAEQAQVRRKLERIRKVLGNAEANAAEVAAALEQVDQDMAAAQVALAEAEAPVPGARPAQAGRPRGRPGPVQGRSPAAVIDRRAYATYVKAAPRHADPGGRRRQRRQLLDRSKLLDNVAKAANSELQALVDAKVAADAGRGGPSPRGAGRERRRGSAPAGRAAGDPGHRAAPGGPRARDRLAAGAPGRPAGPLGQARPRDRGRGGRAPAGPRAGPPARLARLARERAAASRPTVISGDDDGGDDRQPNTTSSTTSPRTASGSTGSSQDLRRPLDQRLAAVRVGAGAATARGRAIDVITWSNRPWVADRQLGGRRRLGARRRVRDLHRPHMDPEPGLALPPPPSPATATRPRATTTTCTYRCCSR